MKDFRLNERQKRFAEENHKVLTDFLKYRNLPMEEFYDIVVFGFLNAVRIYDERKDLKQFKFKTIANRQMYWRLCDYYKEQRKREDVSQTLSLDYPMAGNPNLTLGDCIADERVNICEDTCEKLCRTSERHRIYHISPCSNPKEKQGSRKTSVVREVFWERGAAAKQAEAFAS